MARKRAKHAPTALLIIDAISEFDFPGAGRILRCAPKPLRNISRLKAQVKAAGLPVIYVNDMGSSWEWNPAEFLERCMRPSAKGHELVRLIAPEPDDHFIFKPKHSGFYGTPLNALLSRLCVDTLILTGLTSHQCVLFTAVDAYVHDYRLHVPRDCIGAASLNETRQALFIFKRALMADLTPSKALSLSSRRSGKATS